MITNVAADDLRARTVRELAAYGTLVTDEILAAVGAVPRHVFLPDVPLFVVFGLGRVVTHQDEQGAIVDRRLLGDPGVARAGIVDPRPTPRRAANEAPRAGSGHPAVWVSIEEPKSIFGMVRPL